MKIFRRDPQGGSEMIVLHKFNGDEFVLNVNNIEIIEEKPDTTITLMNEKKYLVKETMEEVVNRATEYYRKIHSNERFLK